MSGSAGKTEEDRAIVESSDFDYFDGIESMGTADFVPTRFWQPVLPDFQNHFGLTKDSSVLDVGCGKGFMLHDLRELIPGITFVE